MCWRLTLESLLAALWTYCLTLSSMALAWVYPNPTREVFETPVSIDIFAGPNFCVRSILHGYLMARTIGQERVAAVGIRTRLRFNTLSCLCASEYITCLVSILRTTRPAPSFVDAALRLLFTVSTPLLLAPTDPTTCNHHALRRSRSLLRRLCFGRDPRPLQAWLPKCVMLLPSWTALLT